MFLEWITTTSSFTLLFHNVTWVKIYIFVRALFVWSKPQESLLYRTYTKKYNGNILNKSQPKWVTATENDITISMPQFDLSNLWYRFGFEYLTQSRNLLGLMVLSSGNWKLFKICLLNPSNIKPLLIAKRVQH